MRRTVNAKIDTISAPAGGCISGMEVKSQNKYINQILIKTVTRDGKDGGSKWFGGNGTYHPGQQTGHQTFNFDDGCLMGFEGYASDYLNQVVMVTGARRDQGLNVKSEW